MDQKLNQAKGQTNFASNLHNMKSSWNFNYNISIWIWNQCGMEAKCLLKCKLCPEAALNQRVRNLEVWLKNNNVVIRTYVEYSTTALLSVLSNPKDCGGSALHEKSCLHRKYLLTISRVIRLRWVLLAPERSIKSREKICSGKRCLPSTIKGVRQGSSNHSSKHFWNR